MNDECCLNSNCGCQITIFPTTEECPNCGGRLRLAGNSQLLEFRLSCPSCGYHGTLLSQEEIQVLL